MTTTPDEEQSPNRDLQASLDQLAARGGIVLAHLVKYLCDWLPDDHARAWPERLMSAIRPGADLSRVHWQLLHWLLTTPEVNPGITHPLVRDAVREVADLMARLADGAERPQWTSEPTPLYVAAYEAANAAHAACPAIPHPQRPGEHRMSREESAAFSAINALSCVTVMDDPDESPCERLELCGESLESCAIQATQDAAPELIALADRLVALIEAAPEAPSAGP